MINTYEYCRVIVIETTRDGIKQRTFQEFGSAKKDIDIDTLIFINQLATESWEIVSYVRNYIMVTDGIAKEEVYILKRLI